MMQIRHGVFETNSSSTHSISISKSAKMLDSLPTDANGIVIVRSNEFGWEEETYNDAETKASYCLTYCKNYDPSKLDMLTRVIMSQTGARVIAYVGESDNDWGYIDHQSSDVCAMAFEDEENLRMFIFNPDSVFITDNDNKY